MKITQTWTFKERITIALACALVARANKRGNREVLDRLDGRNAPNFETLLVLLEVKPEYLERHQYQNSFQPIVDIAVECGLFENFKQELNQHSFNGAPALGEWIRQDPFNE